MTALASEVARPERVIGLHFFSPANVMRLLEIVRGAQTSDATILAGLALAKKLRKVGVVVGDGFGFVGNRMMLDGYFREAETDVAGRRRAGTHRLRHGKFRLRHGTEPRQRHGGRRRRHARAHGAHASANRAPAPYHVVSDSLTALGHLGQKTGRGIYRYETGDRGLCPDPELALLTRALAEKYGVAAREVPDAEIEERCVLSLVNVGAQILDEGLAYRAADIDVVWTSGYGFPRWRGGPMFYADTLGRRSPTWWQPAWRRATGRSRPCCAELAADGRTFADWDRARENELAGIGA